MSQRLLFPDPRPLVERLGPDFFRDAPQSPGVYLMRDAADAVLYIGKAKNLRRRLGSYRVANPDRLPRRHLRLLRAVARIELELCTDEPAAVLREAELLRSIRPRFNRAGTWTGPARHLLWRCTDDRLEFAIESEADSEWQTAGPLGSGARHLRNVIARLTWCALNPGSGFSRLPPGWARSGPGNQPVRIPPGHSANLQRRLSQLFAGRPDSFCDWVRQSTACPCPFDRAAVDSDLEWLAERRVKDHAEVRKETAVSPDLLS